jgi:hypothetical protein
LHRGDRLPHAEHLDMNDPTRILAFATRTCDCGGFVSATSINTAKEAFADHQAHCGHVGLRGASTGPIDSRLRDFVPEAIPIAMK